MICRVDADLFNDAFLPYVQTTTRYEVYYGGRGSGKSKFIAQKLVLRCLKNEYFKLIYCRKVADTIRESQFSLLKATIREFGLSNYFKVLEGTMRIECINGNVMIAKGLDNPEKVKSTDEPSHIWCEEITEFDEDDFTTLDKSIRTEKTDVQAILSFNPVMDTHWVRSYFFAKENRHAANNTFGNDIVVLRTTYKDNKFIDQEKYYLTLLRGANGDANRIRVDIEGDWGIPDNKNPWLYAFNADKHVSKTPLLIIQNMPVNLSFDFNVNPLTCIAGQHTATYGKGSFVHILKEYNLPNMAISDLCKRIKSDFPHAILTATGDATGRNRNAGYTNGDETMWDKVRVGLGLSPAQMKQPDQNPSWSNSRFICNSLMQNHEEYIIDPSCTTLITDCSIAKPVETNNPDQEDKLYKETGTATYGMHMFDTFRYYNSTHFSNFAKSPFV